MSSVPAPRIARLPLSPRTEGSAPDRTAPSLRVVSAIPELYPGLIATIRTAFRATRLRQSLGATSDRAELGRATGARV